MPKFALILLAFFVCIASCSKDKSKSPTGPSANWEDEVANIITNAGKVFPLAEDQDDVSVEDTTYQDDFMYVYEKHDIVDNIESIYYLGLNDDIIWPGNLVKGDHAHDFVYNPITLQRAPVTISISLEGSVGTGEQLSEEVTDPKLSTMRQGINDLLKTAIQTGTSVPAKVEYTHTQVYSKSHMNLFVQADVSYGAGSLDTRFDWSSTSKKNKIMVKYKQIYYSIDIDTPQKPSDFIDPSVTTTEISTAMPAGSMPLYIAGVSYGMMAIMCIETDYSKEQMELALNAAYDGAVNVDLGFGYTAEEVFQSSSIQIIVYGGSTLGLQNLESGYEGLMKVIGVSTNYSADTPGVPLVYKFRHLSDNTLALVTLFSQYTLVRPIQINQRVKFTVDRFVCTMSDDEGYGNMADMDRFAVWINAYNGPDKNGNPGNQINKPDHDRGTTVFYWSTSGEWTVYVGDIKEAGTSVNLSFNTVENDFNNAYIDVIGWHREYDTTSANEEGWGSTKVFGSSFFDNAGKHNFQIESRDAGFRCEFTIKLESPEP